MPPPPAEVPFKYAGRKPLRGKLNDDLVIQARREIGKKTISQLAQENDVSYWSMRDAVKGYSYKHLNLLYPPQL